MILMNEENESLIYSGPVVDASSVNDIFDSIFVHFFYFILYSEVELFELLFKLFYLSDAFAHVFHFFRHSNRLSIQS